MRITSSYINELAKRGLDWSQLRDDHVSGMSKYDIAQSAYLFLLEHPEKSAAYAIAAVIADARRRAAMEEPMPEALPEAEGISSERAADGDLPKDIEVAADVLRNGTAAAAVILRCSRRRVQQLLARDPLSLAARLAAASLQGDLFVAGVRK